MNEQEKKHFNVFQPEGGTVNILGDVNRKFEFIETITLKKKDLVVEAISKNGNVIVSMSSNKFLISRVNFNKLISSEITGVLTNVEGYDLQMFKTLKF